MLSERYIESIPPLNRANIIEFDNHERLSGKEESESPNFSRHRCNKESMWWWSAECEYSFSKHPLYVG